MRILVTGGAGFIGSHYVRTLLSGGYPQTPDARVTVLDKLTYSGNRDNLPAAAPGLEFIHGDICDTGLVRDLMPGHDAVVHFAAESHVDRSIDAAGEFFRTNVVGTEVLLDAAVRAGVERFVHVSTDEVYGSIATGSWTEDWPLAPNSPYAASKAGSDLVARSYWRTHGLDVSISRCSNNYGPHQHTEKLIPLFVTHLLEGRKVPLYGDGHNVREWIHVDDHCRAVHLILTRGRGGEIYNVGGGTELPNTDIAHRVLDLLGADPSAIQRVADRPGHDDRYSLDGSKLRDETGFVPEIPFATGLRETVDWYRNNPAWWKAVKRAAERGGGAPAHASVLLEGSTP
ncbi:dTDP-glucose 4,6-dehydratase [Streptomyces yaizuensis]|uniref:dTDP-glucose 4,6-dehydratase n=1 Tax=Streptomyces yaizuensis TaxID=2989713 RepID=A0ABQ5PA20_9ACTN|nr:dTDP-glucose 4,6-dehydratase [Streptomyces sp. YSPA8]GLF99420.1 dTDP-glucose 4,6-dehydratase [Streptomyces sp. YSPA8]